MGFPTWTLWGMGLSAAGVLLMLVIAYVAQSPRLIKRLGLARYRLDLRARTFTGFALALLLLSLGFFLAGVPLGSSPTIAEAALEETPQAADNNELGALNDAPVEEPTAALEPTTGDPSQPDSGAFAGLPSANRTATAEAANDPGDPTIEATTQTSATPENTATSFPTNTPTLTPSPRPTQTPTPTLTPTPIFEDTAIINVGSSTLWLKRTPAGQDDKLVRGGDIVILMPGHANMGGNMWQEVQTVDGVIGWVLESYLAVEDGAGS